MLLPGETTKFEGGVAVISDMPPPSVPVPCIQISLFEELLPPAEVKLKRRLPVAIPRF